MTAKDVHGKWIHFSKLFRLSTSFLDDKTESQKSQRKRRKGEGGVCRCVSSSHKGRFGGSSSCLTDGRRLSRYSRLSSLHSVLKHSASEHKCRPLCSASRTAPPSPTEQREKSLPLGCHSLRGQDTQTNQSRPHITDGPGIGRGREEKLRESFTPTIQAQ